MKILMLAQFYPPIIGGEERHVRNLSIALAKRGHHVSVATLATQGAPDEEIDEGVKIYRLHGSMQRASFLFKEAERAHAPPFPDPELALALRRIIQNEKPDIVHAHNWLLHSVLPLKTSGGPRFVVTLHDYSHVCARKNMMHEGVLCSGPALAKCLQCAKEQYGAAKATVTTLANFASSRLERVVVDKFLTVSAAVAEGNRLAEFGVPFEVVPNFVPDHIGVLSETIDPRLDQLPKNGFMLFVGDLQRLKGTDKLIEAYATLENARPLVLIGRPGPDTPTNLPPGVSIHHSWPHHAIMHAWNRCDFGIAPSVWPEPCATVVMEAMGVGKPFIATQIGGMPDLVDDGVTGLLVPPGDVPALAKALATLDRDGELRTRMSAAALKKVETLMAKSVVPRIEKIYEDLLARQPREGRKAGLRAPLSNTTMRPDSAERELDTAARISGARAAAKDVTAVVCVHSDKRWNDIEEAVRSLIEQKPAAPRIVVVSDGNKALAARVEAAFPNVEVMMNAFEPGLSGARNTGIAAADTTFVAFLDDDAIAAPDWIESMLEVCSRPGIAGVGPHIAPIWRGARPAWFPNEFLWVVGCSFRPGEIKETTVRNLSGAAMCIRRDVFMNAGGFSSQLGRKNHKLPLSCEETELCMRAARVSDMGRFVCDPASSVGHKVPSTRLTLSYFVKRCYAEGLSKAQLTRLLPDSGALATEKSFASQVLLRSFFRELTSVVTRGHISGVARAGAIGVGFASAAGGYLRGKLQAQSEDGGVQKAAVPFFLPAARRDSVD
ncbi:MAG: glycosyltransferase [Hyphomicrobiaceae bacterium]